MALAPPLKDRPSFRNVRDRLEKSGALFFFKEIWNGFHMVWKVFHKRWKEWLDIFCDGGVEGDFLGGCVG